MPEWREFRRHGDVEAERREHSWEWTTTGGDRLTGAAGDWMVRDGAGNEWSVESQIFEQTYEPVSGGGFRRRGSVLARPARSGETVKTLEGEAVAQAGDWVVRGEAGEEWPVPGDQFAQRYRSIEST